MYPGSSFLALAIFIGAAVTLNVHPRNDLTYRGANALVVREAQGYGVYGYGTTTTTSASGAASSTTASTSAPSSSSSTLAASSTASGSPTTSYTTTTMTATTTSTVSSGSSSGVTTAVGPTLTSVTVSKGNGTYTTFANYTIPHATSSANYSSSASEVKANHWAVALVAGAAYLLANTVS